MTSQRLERFYLYLHVERGQTARIAGKLKLLNLQVEMHGGYIWRRSVRTRRFAWLRMAPWHGTISSPGSIRIFYAYGPVECARRLNEIEYRKLANRRASLYSDWSKNKAVPAIANQLWRRLGYVDCWLGAFANWYSSHGIRLPEAPWTRPVVRGSVATNQSKIITLVRVAPVKYLAEHFTEVDELIAKGYKQKSALDEVATEHSFNREGFEKQYRNKWLNTKKAFQNSH